MNWHACLLNDIADVVTKGTTPTTLGYQFTDDGVNFIKAEALNGDTSLDRDGFSFISNRANDALARSILQEGDVLVTIAGANIGRCGYVCVDYLPANTNQAVGIIRINKNVAHPKFIYYWFKLESTFGLIQSMGGQAAQPNINLATLKRLSVELPPLEQQCSIVRRLELFDDLIENNRRRMAKLEEAARLLYQEWFVRLRFPGHERTRIVNGVPEGWQRMILREVCIPNNGIQTGPFGSQLHQSDYSEVGVPVIMPKDIIGYRIATDSIARIPESLAQSLQRHLLCVGDVVYGRRGDIGRRAYISERQAGWFCGTGCLRLRPNPDVVNPRYFFDVLGSSETSGSIVGRAKGATMPNLNAGIMADVPVVVPVRELQNQYSGHVDIIAAQVDNLSTQNEKLRTARDLLLPRLMSGEIAV